MEKIQKLLPQIDISKNTDQGKIAGKITEPTDDCMYQECDGTGWFIYRMESGKEVMRKCRCLEQKRIARGIKSAGIPDKYVNKRIEDFQENLYKNVELATFAKDAASGYIREFKELQQMGKGLYFYSRTKGAGKSLLSMIINNELIVTHNVQPVYLSVVDMLSELKNSFGNKNAELSSYQLMETFKQAEVLILDDLGVEQTTPWSEEVLTQLLDERMNYKRPTIITSNIKIESLGNKYRSGRIQSRIEKMTFPVRLPEESVRKILSERENEAVAQMLFT